MEYISKEKTMTIQYDMYIICCSFVAFIPLVLLFSVADILNAQNTPPDISQVNTNIEAPHSNLL